MSQGNISYPQPDGTPTWQGQNPYYAQGQGARPPANYMPAQGIASPAPYQQPRQLVYPQQATYQPQAMYNAPVSTYGYPTATQSYNQPKRGRGVFSVFAFVLAVAGALAALLGAVLPFLTRGRSISLIHANVGAGLSVILVPILAAIFIGIAAFVAGRNRTVSRVLALLGGLGGVFLIVFTLANLFGADANRIIDMGGSRGVGGILLVIAGVVMVLSALLAMLASSSSSPARTPVSVPAAMPVQGAVPPQQF